MKSDESKSAQRRRETLDVIPGTRLPAAAPTEPPPAALSGTMERATQPTVIIPRAKSPRRQTLPTVPAMKRVRTIPRLEPPAFVPLDLETVEDVAMSPALMFAVRSSLLQSFGRAATTAVLGFLPAHLAIVWGSHEVKPSTWRSSRNVAAVLHAATHALFCGNETHWRALTREFYPSEFSDLLPARTTPESTLACERELGILFPTVSFRIAAVKQPVTLQLRGMNPYGGAIRQILTGMLDGAYAVAANGTVITIERGLDAWAPEVLWSILWKEARKPPR